MSFFTKFFVLLLISFPLFAGGGSIKGKVTDKATTEALIGANVVIQSLQTGAATDIDGLYEIKNIPAGTYTIKASYVGYESFEHKDVVLKNFQVVELNFELESDFILQEIVVVDKKYFEQKSTNTCKVISSDEIKNLPVRGIDNLIPLQSGVVVQDKNIFVRGARSDETGYYVEGVPVQVAGYEACYSYIKPNTEEYEKVDENVFKESFKTPLSTFAVDVDAASYTNVRRYLTAMQIPPKDAVRVEEFINYFDYDYPSPENEPVKIYTELSKCPWNKDNLLVHIGIKGKELKRDQAGPSNLVFLIDVSGSMQPENKLPLL
ncbi:MAG: von Willebrand factor type A domain-containing protein, partial [Ignavibacteriaceae bacterium]